MVFVAQALRVLRNIEATFFQRLDVIALGCKGDQAKLLAADTQRVSVKQLSTQSLQPSAGDAPSGIWALLPVGARMLSAPARAITRQTTATRMTTWARGGARHAFSNARSPAAGCLNPSNHCRQPAFGDSF
ncbi:hypothetical protein [Variovorax boronicumulans]